MKALHLIFFVLGISLTACTPRYIKQYQKGIVKNPSTQAEKDKNAILNYLVSHQIDSTKSTASGIYYRITKEGTGKHPTANDIVEVHYKGTLLDGTVFDSSYDRNETVTLPLAQVIEGWIEGIPLLREGGKGTLYVPSSLAYGERGSGTDIPPNSVLAFDVELIKILTKEEYKEKQKAQILSMIASRAKVGREKWGEKEDATIREYIQKKGWKATKTEDGIYIVIEKKGNGEFPDIMNQVQVHYKGKFLNGKEFDSSYKVGQPIIFPLTRVIPGWTLGIPKFSKGGKGKLIIPSYLAYGEKGAGGDIPPNSILVFDVELLDIIK